MKYRGYIYLERRVLERRLALVLAAPFLPAAESLRRVLSLILRLPVLELRPLDDFEELRPFDFLLVVADLRVALLLDLRAEALLDLRVDPPLDLRVPVLFLPVLFDLDEEDLLPLELLLVFLAPPPLAPPVCLLTVAQPMRSAVFSEAPRLRSLSSMCSAMRFCLDE